MEGICTEKFEKNWNFFGKDPYLSSLIVGGRWGRVSKTKSCEPLPFCTLLHHSGGESRDIGSEADPRKKRGLEGRCVSYSSYLI